VNGQQTLDGLQFDQHASLYDDIRAICSGNIQAAVAHRDRDLLFGSEPIQLELSNQTTTVSALEQAWSQGSVNLHGGAQDASRQSSPVRVLRITLIHKLLLPNQRFPLKFDDLLCGLCASSVVSVFQP
jgi:hypothetical protein